MEEMNTTMMNEVAIEETTDMVPMVEDTTVEVESDEMSKSSDAMFGIAITGLAAIGAGMLLKKAWDVSKPIRTKITGKIFKQKEQVVTDESPVIEGEAVEVETEETKE